MPKKVKPLHARVTVPPKKRKPGEITTSGGQRFPFTYRDSVFINPDYGHPTLTLVRRKKRVKFQQDERVVFNFRSQLNQEGKGKGIAVAPAWIWRSLRVKLRGK